MLIVCISGSSVLSIFTDIIFFKSHNSLVRSALFFKGDFEIQRGSGTFPSFHSPQGQGWYSHPGLYEFSSSLSPWPEDKGADLPISGRAQLVLGDPRGCRVSLGSGRHQELVSQSGSCGSG